MKQCYSFAAQLFAAFVSSFSGLIADSLFADGAKRMVEDGFVGGPEVLPSIHELSFGQATPCILTPFLQSTEADNIFADTPACHRLYHSPSFIPNFDRPSELDTDSVLYYDEDFCQMYSSVSVG